MKVGGRRQLVIPPEQAYGPAGGGHRLSGKTLIFVIDLLGHPLALAAERSLPLEISGKNSSGKERSRGGRVT